MMRLSNFYQRAIKRCFRDLFGTGNIYLFGSRVDDSKRGGDIDLYLEIDRPPLFDDKLKFLAKLKRVIGDQKIDVVFNEDPSRLIEKEIQNSEENFEKWEFTD